MKNLSTALKHKFLQNINKGIHQIPETTSPDFYQDPLNLLLWQQQGFPSNSNNPPWQQQGFPSNRNNPPWQQQGLPSNSNNQPWQQQRFPSNSNKLSWQQQGFPSNSNNLPWQQQGFPSKRNPPHDYSSGGFALKDYVRQQCPSLKPNNFVSKHFDYPINS